MMAAISYPVVLREAYGAIVACIPDLRCQAVGATRSDAIANVKRIAAKTLRECEEQGSAPPAPSRFSLERVEFQRPAGSRSVRRARPQGQP